MALRQLLELYVLFSELPNVVEETAYPFRDAGCYFGSGIIGSEHDKRSQNDYQNKRTYH